MGSRNSKEPKVSPISTSKKNNKVIDNIQNVGDKGYLAATIAMDSRNTKESCKKNKNIIENSPNVGDKSQGTKRRFTNTIARRKENSKILKALFKKLGLPESMLNDPKFEAEIEQFKRKNSKILKTTEHEITADIVIWEEDFEATNPIPALLAVV